MHGPVVGVNPRKRKKKGKSRWKRRLKKGTKNPEANRMGKIFEAIK